MIYVILLYVLIFMILPYISLKYENYKKYKQLMKAKIYLSQLQQEMDMFIQKVGKDAVIDDFFARYTGFLMDYYYEIDRPTKQNGCWSVDLNSEHIDFLHLVFADNMLVSDAINRTILELQKKVDVQLIENFNRRKL